MPISIRLSKLCADFGLTPYGVRYALEQYQKVIYELTDGKFSKLTYPAELICDTARECFEKDMEYWEEPPKPTEVITALMDLRDAFVAKQPRGEWYKSDRAQGIEQGIEMAIEKVREMAERREDG